MNTPTKLEYIEAINELLFAKNSIELALGSVNRGYSPSYSREASDLIISIDEVLAQLTEDSEKVVA